MVIVYNEQFDFKVKATSKRHLIVSVYDSMVGPPELFGVCHIDLDTLPAEQPVEQAYTLLPKSQADELYKKYAKEKDAQKKQVRSNIP